MPRAEGSSGTKVSTGVWTRVLRSGVWLFVAGPLLLSCRASESFDPPISPLLLSAEPLPVTLSKDVRGLRAQDSVLNKEMSFRIGRLLQRLFPAGDGVAFLSVVSSDLSRQRDRSTGHWRATYALALMLQLDGRSHGLSGLGTGSDPDPILAGRRAIEDCISQVYVQLAGLLEPWRAPGS